MPLWRKILLTIAFLIVAFGFGYLIYRFFFAPTPTNVNVSLNYNINALPNVNLINRPPTNENINVNGALPNANITGYAPPSEVASGGPTLAESVIDEGTQDLVMASNQKDAIYYNYYTGEFKKVSSDGAQETLLTQELYPQAEKVDWSPGRDKAVISFPDDSKIMYDFNQKKQYSLPKETTEFSFSPSGNEIAYKYEGFDPDERWLYVSSPDGSEARIIESLGDKADFVEVNWSPNNQIIASYAKSVSQDRQEIIFLGQRDENFPAVDVQGRGFESLWSPAGDKILYSVYSNETNHNPSLWVMDGRIGSLGAYPQDLGINTWPDKCTFGTSSYVFCAIPSYLSTGSGIYPELADSIPDDFYKIDLQTGIKTKLATPVNTSGYGNFTAEKIFLSANEEFLYFTDKGTSNFYKIRLK